MFSLYGKTAPFNPKPSTFSSHDWYVLWDLSYNTVDHVVCISKRGFLTCNIRVCCHQNHQTQKRCVPPASTQSRAEHHHQTRRGDGTCHGLDWSTFKAFQIAPKRGLISKRNDLGYFGPASFCSPLLEGSSFHNVCWRMPVENKRKNKAALFPAYQQH